MSITDYLRARYPANFSHNSNDPSIFVHGTVSVAGAISGGSGGGPASQSGSWTVSIYDSSGNSIIATNTQPSLSSQGLIVRPLIPTSITSSISNITGTVGSVVLSATDGLRRGVLVVNDSTANLLIKYGLSAASNSYSVRVPSLSYWEMPLPIYQGELDAIWDATNAGAARVTVLQ